MTHRHATPLSPHHMTGRRWLIVAVAGIAVLLGYLTFVFARMPAATAALWTEWLQNAVNVIRLLEVTALAFGAYQFWANRNEVRAAEAEAARRARKDANYQAWQVINSAQGKGGSGGRIDALADLVRNDVSLAGINLDGAWLESIDLRLATLPMASFEKTNLQGARFDGARLDGANFRGANLSAASLTNASLRGADLTGARLSAVNLAGADLSDVRGWREIATVAHANVDEIRAAPRGFVDWARLNGAVDATKDGTMAHPEQSREFRIL
jgi:Pentapeptide repeats (8 copies)